MHIMLFISTLFALIFWHFLADYPLQGDFLSKAKAKVYEPQVPWYQAMIAHCTIHAGGVYYITDLPQMALFEFVSHFMIDRWKCAGKISFNVDQYLHFMCKVLIALVVVGSYVHPTS